MLTRDQVRALLMLRQRGEGPFATSFPIHDFIIKEISDFNEGENSPINIALREAALGEKENIDNLVKMVKENPRLLLQAGNVVNRGGVPIIRTTIYEFLLGEGDPDGAKSIEFGFAEIPDGENQRYRQYNRYKSHIEAMAQQIEAKRPEYDLRPLFDIIKKSTPADITAALNKNMNHESPLKDALVAFRKAVRPKKQNKPGMHYKHYTTLMQAMDLLSSEWEKLSNNYTNYDKCDLVWGQIFKDLQLSLPAVDRFGFARAFNDNERTAKYKYDSGTFPGAVADNDELPGVGINEAIFGGGVIRPWLSFSFRGCFGKHMSSKNFKLAELMQQEPQQHPSGRVVC